MTPQLSMRILFAGGGTGGHLYPALAIANRLKEMLSGNTNLDIAFVGTKRGLEYRIKDELGYPLHLINMRGITRSVAIINVLVPFIMVLALVQSAMLLKKFRPDLVVGTGGYVSWPVLKMAATLGILTVLQEQNSYPGIATRSGSKKAKRIYLGFDEARKFIAHGANAIYTGNPVRSEINKGSRELAIEQFKLKKEKKTILILGGSQGARAINNAVLKSLRNGQWAGDVQLLWQTGKRDYTEVNQQASGLHWDGALFPFANNMHDVYAAADLVIARAGALTIAELTACGLPSILVPFPFAAGDHQKKNAESLSAKNAALVIDEMNLQDKDILVEAVELLGSPKYLEMKQAVARLTQGRKPAVDVIADDIITLINETKQVESGH
ncbi:MAG TPA: undecaprenyldiphospho-muramoylpentapeptide beta-N-acetylglucosaminyltransferase [candidate division Zixibacteria bacterium]|nr:undecaprenyldiphospho-muramoylpentapeptide beta-N-acetylglucosaminyltransferase [candidate division Zixibacteria bacterium]